MWITDSDRCLLVGIDALKLNSCFALTRPASSVSVLPLGCLLGRRLLVSRCSWYSTEGGGKNNEENPVLEVGEQNLKHWVCGQAC